LSGWCYINLTTIYDTIEKLIIMKIVICDLEVSE